MQKNTILIPQYMKKFECIGSACEYSCCQGWKIQIDEDTYKKYKKLKKSEIKLKLDKLVTRNRSDVSNLNYAKIRLDDKGSCPFLRDDMLCDIYKTLGPEYLSQICTTYPRSSRIVNGILEKSAALSCPEAARLALLNPNPMEFDESEESSDTQNYVSYKFDTNDLRFTNNLQKYFWDIRIFSISLLQNRSYRLWERLIILGFFIRKVEDVLGEGLVNTIPNIIEEYNNIIESGNLKKELIEIPIKLELQIDIINMLNDVRLSTELGTGDREYVKCVYEFMEGLNYTEDMSLEKFTANYSYAFENYFKPFMDGHEYILENLIVNNAFKDLFPLSFTNNVFEGYISIAISYALIKVMLIGMSQYHKGLNEDIIIRLICSFSRTIEHSGFMNIINKLLKENGYDTLAYMAILIKN